MARPLYNEFGERRADLRVVKARITYLESLFDSDVET